MGGERLKRMLIVNGKHLKEGQPAALIRSNRRARREDGGELWRIMEPMGDGCVFLELFTDARGAMTDARIIAANAAFERLTGRRRAKLEGRLASEAMGQFALLLRKLREQRLGVGESCWYEEYFADVDRWFRIYGFCPQISRVAVIFADISEGKRAERALRASEAKYRTLFEAMTEGFAVVEVIYDGAGRPADWAVLDVNPAWERQTGLSRERVLGKRVTEFMSVVEPVWLEQYGAVVESGEASTFEAYSAFLERWFEVHASPLGEANRLAVTFSDISGRKRLEEALWKQSEDRFQKIFSGSPAMIAIVRMADNRYVEVNEKFLEVWEFSKEEVLGRTPVELGVWTAGGDLWETLVTVLRETGEVQNIEFTTRTRSGRVMTVLASKVLITLNGELCAMSIMLDISKEKKYEAELLRLDRLNTVGEMAASIGHEVRNPMTTVRGYLQMLQRKPEIAGYRGQFQTMIEELDRANFIISEFLSLAKNKTVELKAYNLNDVVSTLLPLLQAEAYRTGHELEIEMGEVADVDMDEKEIRQLLLNLTRNGFEAMEAGGRLTIATYGEGGRVVLAVEDTGRGIPPEVLARLGTPFLSTKANGSGLGLAVCYRIAERHRATIDVQTSPQGTRFAVSFRM